MGQTQSSNRLGTGVPGLDVVLDGGVIPGSVFIVQGSPGAGKTILANQICFNHARAGQKALYVTLLAESHDRLLAHLGRLQFFDPRQLPDSIYFISGFDTLTRDGLKGILHLLRSESRSRQASLIVLDGLFALEETAQSAKEFRKFINDLTTLSALMGCTVLLLTNNSRSGAESVEYTMVDGWIQLEMEQRDSRAMRYLRILKYRGSGFVDGRHAVTIDDAGMHVLPRLEAVVCDRLLPLLPAGERLSTGASELDALFGGGVPAATATLLVGPTGVGKTTIGLHFMAACSASEPGLIFSFFETEAHLRSKCDALGLRLGALIEAGHIEVERHAPTEQQLDGLAHRLIERVRQRGVKRLLVDGIGGFSQSAADPERLPRFLSALTTVLRSEGVALIYTYEVPQLGQGQSFELPVAVSSVAQNIVFARYVELESELRRVVAVLKVRDSAFEPKIRQFEIGPTGLTIGEPLPAGTRLLG